MNRTFIRVKSHLSIPAEISLISKCATMVRTYSRSNRCINNSSRAASPTTIIFSFLTHSSITTMLPPPPFIQNFQNKIGVGCQAWIRLLRCTCWSYITRRGRKTLVFVVTRIICSPFALIYIYNTTPLIFFTPSPPPFFVCTSFVCIM